MYGGVEESGIVSSELWAFDVSAKTWENITVRSDPCNTTKNSTGLCGEYFFYFLLKSLSHSCLFFLRFGGFLGPLRSAGHSATLIKSQGHDDRMVIIFGHSPLYGYLNTVQEFVFGEFILYPYFL